MDLLKKLVGIRSYSEEELELANFISSYFQDRQYDVCEHKGNVIVHIKNNSENCIIFNAHMDTVKVQSNWNTDPFELVEKDGKYYGLGISDEKVSIAILMKIADAIRENPHISSDIILAFVTREETDGLGSQDFIDFFKKKYNFEKVVCVICEPRNSKYLGIGAKGNIFFKAKYKGVANHSSEPNGGDNAILKALDFKLNINEGEDILGKTTLAYPTKISGGTSINTIPDECVTFGDIRTNTLTHESILSQLEKMGNVEVISESLPFVAKNQKLIDFFVSIGINKLTCTNGSNDATFFENVGISSIVFGAGNEECCHVANEYVEIKNIKKAMKIYLRLCEEYTF